MLCFAENAMTEDEFNILNTLYDASIGREKLGGDLAVKRSLLSQNAFSNLENCGLIDSHTGILTKEGLAALAPYRVDSAVILAAGSATRFVPLSLELPKGLYEVRGERLIERQIQQLREAGIEKIVIVVGYKKDMFAYLAEKYGVTLLFNPSYNVKNNIESILTAKEWLKNSYVCMCDQYFVENPFHSFECCSFYAGYSTAEQRREMYAHIDADGRITRMELGEDGGLMLLGHTFWAEEFSQAFIAAAEADYETGTYANKFWEWLVRDNLDRFPPLFFKEYAPGVIYEFDYFEQLRQFDAGYVSHAKSEILRNIKLVFRCDEEDIIDFRTVSEGLTNTSFVFQVDGVDYIYRHPGDGTERIINRRNEKTSLIKAREYGFDPTYVYMDAVEGWKISRFIREFREPVYASFDDAKLVAAVLRRLHSAKIEVNYGMKPWEDACAMERLLKEKDADCFAEHEELKAHIESLYNQTVGDGVLPCFCHGDTYRPNWMIEPNGNVILIDWEYSGISDPGIDVGYYVVDAMYDYENAQRFIREYLGDRWADRLEFHYMAYVAIIAYYWFVWAMYRESCGANMGESLGNWHEMALRFCDYLLPEAIDDVAQL